MTLNKASDKPIALGHASVK